MAWSRQYAAAVAILLTGILIPTAAVGTQASTPGAGGLVLHATKSTPWGIELSALAGSPQGISTAFETRGEGTPVWFTTGVMDRPLDLASGNVTVHLHGRTAPLPGTYSTRVDLLVIPSDPQGSARSCASETFHWSGTSPPQGEAPNWSTMTFAISPCSIDQGSRLNVYVYLVGTPEPGPRGLAPSVFLYGGTDAPTFVQLPADRQDFSRLVPSRERIGEGLHTGHFSRPMDHDDYAISPGPGTEVVVAARRAAIEVWSPDGDLLGGTFVAGDGGEHILRVKPERGVASPADEEYEVFVDFR